MKVTIELSEEQIVTLNLGCKISGWSFDAAIQDLLNESIANIDLGHINAGIK